MKIYIAHWWDAEDKMFRVAGVYLREKNAERRIEQLGSGTVQVLLIGKPVIFTHEQPTTITNIWP
jgi:allophanate hydrolase subunit 2